MKDKSSSIVIGKVSATEKNPSTIDSFYFWTDKNQILSPFDIVKVPHLAVSNNEKSITYGVIEEINHVTDSQSHFSSFISSDFGSFEEGIGSMNRLGMNYVKVNVTCNTDDIYSPVLDGSQVMLCDEDDIKKALGLTEQDVKNPLVCGYLQMYRGEYTKEVSVKLNANFLIGPEGAHLNVSGISGLAAKTSYSMFLLNALQHKFRDENGKKIAFVLFNVKGRDLMYLDEKNPKLSENDVDRYKKLELSTEPFKNVKYYYPFSKDDGCGNIQSYIPLEDFNNQRSNGKAFIYKFPYERYVDNLELLLANEDDSTGTMESCINHVVTRQSGFETITRWDSFIRAIQNFTIKSDSNKTANNTNITAASWKKFSRCIQKAVDQSSLQKSVFFDDIYPQNNEVDLSDVISEDLTSGDVIVIDIARLDETTQGFVFGCVAKSIYDMKLGSDRKSDAEVPDKVILFVDELNKYASKETPKTSPILKQLLEITERGRSLGIILFSVEQFRSAIHDRVKGNCATAAYGRTNAIEISKPDYTYIPQVYKNMLTKLSPGEYIIQNPALRSIIKIKFPRPTYKQDE